MKYYALALIAAVSFTACNSATKTEEATTETTTTETPATEQVASAGPVDPVCNMTKDATWTEYTVNGADTVWFCSETCKTAYIGNPAKYSAATTN
jgi:YHS domain-containing protein